MQLPSADQDPKSSAVTALSAHLKALGWTRQISTIVALSTPGTGNMNHTLRIHLQDDAVKTRILKQSLPYVAKYPDIPAPITRDLSEAAFYQSIQTDASLAQHCPALIGHDQTNHLLCFEDLGAGLDFTHLYPQNTAHRPSSDISLEPALASLLEWLSRLHRLPAPANFPSNQAMRDLNHAHIFELPFSADSHFAEHTQIAAWQSDLIQDAVVMQQIKRLGELYLGSAASGLRSSNALLHGDFYPGSWLQASSGQAMVRIIDPEFGFVGPAEFDLGVLSAHLTFAGWSTGAQDVLLQHYQPPIDFNHHLAAQFGAVEVMRRLLGVAKLPMQASVATQVDWLNAAAATIRRNLT